MPHIEIAAERLFTIFGFPVTNTLVTSWMVVLLLIVFSQVLAKSLSVLPKALQNIFEIFVEKMLDLLEGMFGDRNTAEKYFPIIATIFLFILTSNWLGILPGIGSIGFYEEAHGERLFIPMFRSAASDLNFTLGLAILTVVMVNIIGIKTLGVGKHISKYFSFKGPIDFFVGILEFILEFAKIISFSFRLFGNIFAGEVLLIIAAFLAPFAAPVPFLMLELFVGFIQALVFSMLTAVFIGMSISHQH